MDEDYPINKSYYDIQSYDHYPEPNWESEKPQTREEFFSRFEPLPEHEMSEKALAFKKWLEEDGRLDNDVYSPSHYKVFPDAEAIDIIERSLTRKEFVGYLKGNILKYRLRAGHKDDAEKDIKKAIWYEEELEAYEETYSE